MGYAAQHIPASRRRTATARLITGGKDASGQAAWFFIVPWPHRVPLLEKAIRQGQLNVNDYAEVVASGYGDTPPTHVLERMQRHYGFNH